MAKYASPKKPQKRGTKAALAASFAALLLCGATLVGTTFAWFTDTATTGNNKIVAGNLDVELEMWDETANNGAGEWKNISKETKSIFGEEDSLTANKNNANTLWEPGKTQMAYFRIKNEGNLALKYQVWLNTKDEDEDLYKAMRYQVVQNWNAETDGTLPEENLTANNYKQPELGDRNVSLADSTGTQQDGHLAVKDHGVSEHYFALAVHMDENADNDYMSKEGDPKEIAFDLAIHAIQDTVESDSFDNTYDAGLIPFREIKQLTGDALVLPKEAFGPSQTQDTILNFGVQFKTDESAAEVAKKEYANYHLDYVLTFSQDIPMIPVPTALKGTIVADTMNPELQLVGNMARSVGEDGEHMEAFFITAPSNAPIKAGEPVRASDLWVDSNKHSTYQDLPTRPVNTYLDTVKENGIWQLGFVTQSGENLNGLLAMANVTNYQSIKGTKVKVELCLFESEITTFTNLNGDTYETDELRGSETGNYEVLQSWEYTIS